MCLACKMRSGGESCDACNWTQLHAEEQHRPEAFCALPLPARHAAGLLPASASFTACHAAPQYRTVLSDQDEAAARRFGAKFAQDMQPGAYQGDKDPALQVILPMLPA